MTKPRGWALSLCCATAILLPGPAGSQSVGPLPTIGSIANMALDKIPLKKLFGAQKIPANLSARAIGSYARGCLAGASMLPVTGPAWQAMRLSRNRYWGHPALIALIERLATDAKKLDGWNGLMIGDISQPRGGPMLDGHASHQIGLDADIWLTPMPDHELTPDEREKILATPVVLDHKHINSEVWTEAHARLIKRAASYPEVARIFVHPPIKAELCRWAIGDRSWLAKVRPYYGHDYHFHVRINCPPNSPGCKNQWTPKPKDGTGCGEELAWWLSDAPWRPPKPPSTKQPPPKPPKPMTISALPAECRAVVTAE
jgi:penicillin-insensitive murein endopeptidase